MNNKIFNILIIVVLAIAMMIMSVQTYLMYELTSDLVTDFQKSNLTTTKGKLADDCTKFY